MKDMYISMLKSLGSFAVNRPLMLSFVMILIFGIPITWLSMDRYNDPIFLDNILVEAHGLIFDLIVVGFLFSWIKWQGEKFQRIRWYREEIEHFRDHKDKEAAHQMADNARRLSKEGITSINLADTYLRGADLRGIDLCGADLRGANLCSADLRGANLEQVALHKAVIDTATQLDDKWHLAWKIVSDEQQGRDLRQVNLSKTNLSGVMLAYANLTKANLQEADLSGEANLAGANLRDARLEDANLHGANLEGANLEGANLHGADLEGTNLRRANLRNADLRNANLEEADISSADLGNAKMLMANLRNVKKDRNTKLNPYLDTHVDLG